MIVPGAGCVLLADLVAGRRRTCEVVVAGGTAVHAETGDADLPLLSVVRSGGARLPGSVILSPRLSDLDWTRIQDAGAVTIGAGMIDVGRGSLVIQVRRWWDRPLVTLSGTSARLAPSVSVLSRVVAGAGHASNVEIISGSTPSCLLESLMGRIGLGPGLTPEADDVLSGALTTWFHLGATGEFPAASAAVTAARSALPGALGRTTSVSAALLGHAIDGRSVVELHELLDALRRPGLITDRVSALARIGRSTGPALTAGASIALRSAVDTRTPDRLAS